MSGGELSGRRKFAFTFFAMGFVLVAIAVMGEILVSVISPQQSLYPRREFSAEYGFVDFKNTTMVHELRDEWHFEYTTNQYRHRGKAVPVSNAYDLPNLVVLGDSFSFGFGTNDGEEYPYIMGGLLEGKYNVANLAVGGWGLTQQIRKYYELGQLYHPKIVLLQYSANDMEDNFNNKVTVIENGKFRFVDSNSNLNWIKKYLSKSILQKSQLYNLIRENLYRFYASLNISKAENNMGRTTDDNVVSVRDKFYIDLLDIFARDLHKKGIVLLMISVNEQMDIHAPHIKARVMELDKEGILDYVEVTDYFEGVTDYRSPEGHRWGVKAHRILGDNLSRVVLDKELH